MAAVVRTSLALLIGPVIGLMGVALCAESAIFAAHAKTAEGVVVESNRITVSDRHTSGTKYRLRVEFVTAGGTRTSFDDPEGTTRKREALVGAKVTVYYDPARPTKAKLNRSGNLGSGVLLTASGVLVSGVVTIIRRRRRTPTPPTSSPL
jgi:hypothetical protein